jgi:hypothetical protein
MAAPDSIAEGSAPPLAPFLHPPLPVDLLVGLLADDGGGSAR